MNKLYENGGVEKARSQLSQMEAMRDRMLNSGDKTGLAELDKNINAMKSMVDVLGAGPDKGIHAMLKTALDPSKMHADTWANFLKNDGPKIAGAIGGAVAGAVIIGATLGTGTPFVVAAGAMALGGAAGGLLGGELASEANHLVRNQFDTGPVEFSARSRLGSYLSGDKILDPRTMEYREAELGKDVALPYAKQFTKDAVLQFATMGLAKGFGAGLSKVLGNSNVASQIAARGAAIESVYGKEVAKRTMADWSKTMAKEFAEELGDEGLEHIVQNGLNDVHPGLGMASSLLVATGRSGIDATRVRAGDFNIDYNASDAGHVRSALEASGFDVTTNQESGLITAKNQNGEIVTFKPGGDNPQLNWDAPPQTLSQAEAKVDLANKRSSELKSLEPGSEEYRAKEAEIQQLRAEAGKLDQRALQPDDSGQPSIDRGSRDPETATERRQLNSAESDLQKLRQQHGDGPYEGNAKQQMEAAQRRVESAEADLLKQQESSPLRLDNADKPPSISAQDVQNMKPEDWQNMIPKAVKGLSADALADVPLENLAGMTNKAYQELPQQTRDRINQAALESDPEAFGKMSPEMISKLPADVLNNLSPEHLSQMSTETVSRMQQANLNDLSPDRLAAIQRPGKTVSGDRVSRVADYRLSEAARTALDRAQAAPENLSKDQVRDLVSVADRHGSYETRHEARGLMQEKGLTREQLFGGQEIDRKLASPEEQSAYKQQAVKDARQNVTRMKSDLDAVNADLRSGQFKTLSKQYGMQQQLAKQEAALEAAKTSGDSEAIAKAQRGVESVTQRLQEVDQELSKLSPEEQTQLKADWKNKLELRKELEKTHDQARSALPKIESGQFSPTPPGRTERAKSASEVLGKDYKPSETGWTEGQPGDSRANLQAHFEKHAQGQRDNGMKIAEFSDPANPLPPDLKFQTADGREIAYADIKTPQEYDAAARHFVENPDKFPGTEMVVKPNGDIHYYNPNYDLEAMTDPKGNMRTFFRSKMVDHQQGYDHWVERTQPGVVPDSKPDLEARKQAPAETSQLKVRSGDIDQLSRQYLTDQKLDPKMLDDVQIHRGVDADGRQIDSPHVTRDENGQLSMYLPEDQNGMVRAHDFGHELDHVIALKQGGQLEGSLREANDAALNLRKLREQGATPEAIAQARERYRDSMAEHTAEARGHRFVGWRIDQLAAGNKPSGKPQSPKLQNISQRQEQQAQRHDQRVEEQQARAQFERDPHNQPPLQSLQQGEQVAPQTTPETDTEPVDGVEGLMRDSFSKAEFEALNPGEYHDAQHALNVANTVNGIAQNMGRSPERAKFLSQVALLHDADERVNPSNGEKGKDASPASVQRTLHWMDSNQESLQERMGWDSAQFSEAKALIARTDFPFNDAAKPNKAGTKFDGQSPVETYQKLLSDLTPEQQKRVLEDGQILRFADQTGNYTGSQAEAERYVQGLQTELNSDGVMVTFDQLRAGTSGFMDMAGNDGDQDRAVAEKLGIKDAAIYDRQELMDAMPDPLRRNFENNQQGFTRPLNSSQAPLRLDNDTRAALPRTLSRPDGSTFQIPADGSAIMLGRAPAADGVVLSESDLGLSRKHAQMRMKDGRLQILDQSTHGTQMNGRSIEPGAWTDVAPGASLQLGEQRIDIPFVDRAQLNSGSPTQVQNPDGTSSMATLKPDGSLEVTSVENTVKDAKQLKNFKAPDAPKGIMSWLSGTPKLEVGKDYIGPDGRQKYLGTDKSGNHQFGRVNNFESVGSYENHLRKQSNNLMMDQPIKPRNLPAGIQRDPSQGDGSAPIKPGEPYKLMGLNGNAIDIPTDGTVGKIGRLELGASDNVSREHAEIKMENGQFMVRDVGSSNGTFINGKRIEAGEWTALPPGSSFRLGSQDVVRPNADNGSQKAPAIGQTKAQTQDVSQAEAKQILDQAQIPNSELRPAGQEALTTQELQNMGLQPTHKMTLGGKEVYLSKPFDHNGKRTGFIAYVKDPETGTVKQRVFYQSNSQGLWRSASHGGYDGWIGKGSKDHAAEASTNLPVEMQKELHRLSAPGQPRAPIDGSNSNQAFYGGLPVGGNAAPADFVKQMDGVNNLGRFTRPGDPSSFQFHHPEQAPSFTQGPSDSYTFQHPSRGEIQAQVFPSKDGSLNYVFFKDPAGRSWLSQVDSTKSELTDFGVRNTAVDAGGGASKYEGLDVPAIEYDTQILSGFQGEAIPGGRYMEATNYTHQLPIIADYLRWANGN